MSNYTQEKLEEAMALVEDGLSQRSAAIITGVPRSTLGDKLREINEIKGKPGEGPDILFIDVESAPILGNVWRLFKQNVGLNQIERDWYLLSYAAKWADEDYVYYSDKRDSWDNEDDKSLLEEIWMLLDRADIVIGHNMRNFDHKKINARFLHNDMSPPSPYRIVDTLEIAKRAFGFTSNKLAYLTDKLCKTYKKLEHGQFPGFELWKECLLGNPAAWSEMAEYNKYDVLSLQELYEKLRPWDSRGPNLNLYYSDVSVRCSCGSDDLKHSGYWYTNLSKFDQFTCNSCGAHVRGRVNLLTKDKRDSLNANIAN